MTIKTDSIIENERLLSGIKARQGKLKSLSTYLFEIERQISSIFKETPDAVVFLDESEKIIKIGTKNENSNIQKVGLIQLKQAS